MLRWVLKNDHLIRTPISAAPRYKIQFQVKQFNYIYIFNQVRPATSTKHQLINVNVLVGLKVPSKTEVAYQVVQQKFQSVSHDPLNDSCVQTRPLNH